MGRNEVNPPKRRTHLKFFQNFSRNQVNQVNRQTHIYYISRNYLELGRILESKHCLKNFALVFLEKPSQLSQPPNAHILYLEKLSRARANHRKQTLFEKFGLEK